MSAPRGILNDARIALRSYAPGRHRVPCPECAKGKGDTALSVLIDDDGLGCCWSCWRCQWSGGKRADKGCETFATFLRRGPKSNRRGPQTVSKATIDGAIRVQAPEFSGPTHDGPTKAAPEFSCPTHDGTTKRDQTLAPYWRDFWRACEPIDAGTPAYRYLVDHRRVGLPTCSSALRWHPNHRHPEGYTGPVLVGLITDIETCEPISLHRTWLQPDGVGKADVPGCRRYLYQHRKNGCIRLTPDPEVTMGLAISEGVETALAALQAGYPSWALLDAGNLANMPPLAGIESLTIFADHDEPNHRTGKRAGHEAARACRERWLAAGRECRIWMAGTKERDFADEWRTAA